MARTTGTATEHALTTLRQYPDNELTIADLFAAAEGKFTKENLHNALTRLLATGKVVKTIDGTRSAWWAISAQGLEG